ncbi:MAG: PsbP-related protein [bacterium]
MKNLSVLTALVAIALFGCAEKKIEPIVPGEMKEYKDPGMGWSISYPANWPIVNAEVGHAHFYNASGVDSKFRVPNEPGTVGAEIAVDVAKTSDPAAEVQKNIAQMKSGGFQVEPEEKVTVNGMAATKVKYGANYGKNSIIYGHHVYITKDSLVYDLGFAGFGQFYGAYAQVFDAALNSFKAAKPKEKGADETLPSEAFTTYNGKTVSFDYPDNFNPTGASKGSYEEVAELRGVRQDCSIRYDVSSAKELTLEKVFAQNKGLIRGGSAGKATVGGQPAMTLSGAVTKDVQRKMYFVVMNNKIMRFTTDWFRPQSAQYQAAYDKAMASVKFK